MYQFRLGKIGKELESQGNWAATIALCLALLGIASASILIAIASIEIKSNAITCDRLLIAAIAFITWNNLNKTNNIDPDFSSEPTPVYTVRAIFFYLWQDLALLFPSPFGHGL